MANANVHANPNNPTQSTTKSRKRAKKEKLDDYFNNSHVAHSNHVTEKYNNSIVKRDELDLDFFGLDALNFTSPSSPLPGSNTSSVPTHPTVITTSSGSIGTLHHVPSLTSSSSPVNSSYKFASQASSHVMHAGDDMDELKLLGITNTSKPSLPLSSIHTNINTKSRSRSRSPLSSTSGSARQSQPQSLKHV